MEIEICAVSGYSEVGKNMTAIKAGDDVVIVDMGVSIQDLIEYEREKEGNSAKALDVDDLIRVKAIPDDRKIEDWAPLVKAIVLGHAHYDHIAAVEFLAKKYKCPIIGTKFTLEVLKSILRDDYTKIPNKLLKANLNEKMKISENITIELIPISHSTLQCALVAVHTPSGIILYANDFKLDSTPVLGEKPNYKRLKQLGEEGSVLTLISESMNAGIEGKTPSERVAREMLKDVLLDTDSRGKVIFVTTFASNIARLKSAVEFGRKIGRRVVIMGRSMVKYIEAAEKLGVVRFSKEAELVAFGSYRRRKLKEIGSKREKYLVITTGSQGEPGSVLDKIVNNQLPFNFHEGDIVVFSCRTIPVPLNIANRDKLESQLKEHKVRMFMGVHSSGHAAAEDLRELIMLTKPKHLIPSQGDLKAETSLAKIAEECGYKIGVTVHILNDGQRIKF